MAVINTLRPPVGHFDPFYTALLTSNWKLWIVDQTGNVLRVAVLVDEVVLGDVVDQVLHTLLVAGQRVIFDEKAPVTNIYNEFKFSQLRVPKGMMV